MFDFDWFDDLQDFANDALDWWDDLTEDFNPNAKRRKTTKKIVDTGKAQWDSIDFDDPASFDQMYDDPFLVPFQPVLDWYKNKKIREDSEKWYDDYYENTGENWRNSQYPWKSYYENGPGRYSGAGNIGDLFEASWSVMSLYKKWW